MLVGEAYEATDGNINYSELARKIGKSRSWVCETMLLYGALRAHPRLEDKKYSRNLALKFTRKQKKIIEFLKKE